MKCKKYIEYWLLAIILIPFSFIAAQNDPKGFDIQMDKYDAGNIFESRYFKLRGTKGFFWTPEQYLAEIPILKKYHMNFLATCYGSFYKDYAYEDGNNEWKKPLTEEQKKRWAKVVEECRKNDILFCFGMNPMLKASEPLILTSESDFRILFDQYRWFQNQGVKWFYVAIDDVTEQQHEKIKIDGKGHSQFVNKLHEALKAHDPEAKMIFCPTWYWGATLQENAKRVYLEEVGNYLAKDIFVFWTGSKVVPHQISLQDVLDYKEVLKHELILWDNYPVNDFYNSLHLGPLTGRDPDIYKEHYGIMSNPMRDNEMNRLPLFTMADYMFDPVCYDPDRSIVQAIKYIAETPSQQQVLKELVEMYPGHMSIEGGKTSLNNIRRTYENLNKDKKAEAALLNKLEALLQRFEDAFPAQYSGTKNIMENDIKWIREKSNFK